MCGIFFSVATGSCPAPQPSNRLEALLKARGPDSDGLRVIQIPFHGESTVEWIETCFYSTVLSLRGDKTVQQPIVHAETGCVLCWNGEAWKIGNEVVKGNDTQCVFEHLIDAVRLESEKSGSENDKPLPKENVVSALRMLAGPFAFVFYDAINTRVYYGRDRLGRRSLLSKHTNSSFVLASVKDETPGWVEVEAGSIFVLDYESRPRTIESKEAVSNLELARVEFNCKKHAWTTVAHHLEINREVSPMEDHASFLSSPDSPAVAKLGRLLHDSMALRVCSISEWSHLSEMTNGAADASQVSNTHETRTEAEDATVTPFAILFSGGLDCTVLARLLHSLLLPNTSIDLLNVAFENPRLQKASKDHGLSQYDLCPDRITARSSLAELQSVCGGRHWRLVEIDIPYSEVLKHRSTVIELMSPHDTEMDLSIALALYFAARGEGAISEGSYGVTNRYRTPARVLFSGLGADELFGGYVRHETAFKHRGHTGLLDELQLDYSRLGKRNLGRDDRVISHWGKEARYPYLDESLVNWAINASVDEKCGFAEAAVRKNNEQVDDFLLPEPGKLVLRLLAQKLGLKKVSHEKKRAIQFGSRTAKMEGKTTGTAKIKSNVEPAC